MSGTSKLPRRSGETPPGQQGVVRLTVWQRSDDEKRELPGWAALSECRLVSGDQVSTESISLDLSDVVLPLLLHQRLHRDDVELAQQEHVSQPAFDAEREPDRSGGVLGRLEHVVPPDGVPGRQGSVVRTAG